MFLICAKGLTVQMAFILTRRQQETPPATGLRASGMTLFAFFTSRELNYLDFPSRAPGLPPPIGTDGP